MEQKLTDSTKLQDCTFDQVLQQYAEKLIQCIAWKFKIDYVVGMEHDDLCNLGRERLWTHYEDLRKASPNATVVDLIKVLKASLPNAITDVQRKCFSQKRTVNAVVDLGSMIDSLEDGDGVSAIDNFLADPRSKFGVIDLETRDLLEDAMTRMTTLQARITMELHAPSDRLMELMNSRKSKRNTSRVSIDALTQLFGLPYDEVRKAYLESKVILARYMARHCRPSLPRTVAENNRAKFFAMSAAIA